MTHDGRSIFSQYTSQLERTKVPTQPLKMPQKKPAPSPTRTPIKKLKKQCATLVLEDKPAPPQQDHATMQLSLRDQPSPAWESPEDESPSGSNDREEPTSARAPGEQQEEDSGPDYPPSHLSQATGKGSCKSKNPRKNFHLTPEQEENILEWLSKKELLWRRGHIQFKDIQKKRSLWEQKAQEFGLTAEHIKGWWRGMQTWYVKLHKVKSGQAAKKLTDREMYVLENCSFYEGQLRRRSTAPLKPVSNVSKLFFIIVSDDFQMVDHDCL